MSLQHSPAEIVAKYLTDQTVFSTDTSADWALFISHFPDRPSRMGIIRDTAGTVDGQYMRDGEVVEHPGINLQTRGKSTDTDDTLYDKMNEALVSMEAIENAAVTVDLVNYVIQVATLASGPISLGVRDSQRRPLWSMNFIVSVRSAA